MFVAHTGTNPDAETVQKVRNHQLEKIIQNLRAPCVMKDKDFDPLRGSSNDRRTDNFFRHYADKIPDI